MNRNALWRAVVAVLKSDVDDREISVLASSEFSGIRSGVAKVKITSAPEWLDTAALSQKLSQAFSTVAGKAIACRLTKEEGGEVHLPHPPRPEENLTFDNYLIGPSNRLAHAAVLSCSEVKTVKFNPVLIIGDEGLGKTHLLSALCQRLLGRKRVYFFNAQDFTDAVSKAAGSGEIEKLRSEAALVEVLIFDDLHELANADNSREEFFSLFNSLLTRNRLVVISSAVPPAEIAGFEERIVSRLQWGISIAIEKPNLETRLAILNHLARRFMLELDEVVAKYLAGLFSNGKQIEDAVSRLGVFARLAGRKPTLGLVREVFGHGHVEEVTPAIDEIQAVVADEFAVTRSELNGKTRRKSIAWPRQVAMYLAREMTTYTLEEIGGLFGGRDHATVVHAHRRVSEILLKDSALRKRLAAVRGRILDEKNRRTRSAK